ncbi:MAG: hypothetical protein H0Z24_08435 [Thermosipho sp. (in: Bacteria)]|nr:hypothetical protein [Thermosipho sp. (in: thermotogales)]
MKRYLWIIEIILLYAITLIIPINSWFSLFYLVVIAMEIYKDVFSNNIDEMERYLRFKVSNIALYAIIIASIFFISCNINITRDVFYFFILFPLVLKNLLYIGYILEREKVIKRTGYIIFGVLIVFTLLSHGFTFETLIESLPWFFILFSTFVAIRYRIIGFVLFFLSFSVVTYFAFRSELNAVKLLVYSLLGIPLLFLSIQSLRKE